MSRLSEQEGRGSDPRSDEELLREAQQDFHGPRGRTAAVALVARYQRPILVWCTRYVRDRERALDLAQDVLMKVWTSLPEFGHRSKFSWWVFVVTRNRCLNSLKQAAHAQVHEEISLEFAHDQPGVDENMEAEERTEFVRQLMLTHLDELEREALALSYFENLPVETITHRLGLDNASGARGLLQRARRKLRRAVGDDQEESG